MKDELLMLPLSAECSCFLRALVLGAALSILFSVFAAIRKSFGFTALWIAVWDVVYCLFSGLATFLFLLYNSSGRLRWYILLGELLGWAVFHLSAGGLLAEALSDLLTTVFRIIYSLLKLIFKPFLLFAGIFGSLRGKFTANFYKIAKKLCQNRKFCLKNLSKSLYNSHIPYSGGKRHFKKSGGSGMPKRRKRRANWLMRIFVLCFVAYVAISLIGMQVEVTAKRRYLASIEREIYRQEQENAEIKRVLDGGTDREYIERIARDKLGFAYPDEKIFIDRSGG